MVLSLDADFLASGRGMVRYTRDFAGYRRVAEGRTTMNRLYAVESTPSLTGAKADHPSQNPQVATAAEIFASVSGSKPRALPISRAAMRLR